MSTVAIGRSFMPSAERSEFHSAGSRFRLSASTRYAERASQRASSLPVSGGFKLWNGTQRQRPARGRVCSWSLRSGVAAKRSGEQRIETPESGNLRVGSLRTNQRRPRRAGTSIVTGAIGAQSAGASFWLRCAACVALDTRRLTASASEARPASAPCSHRDSSPVSEMECAGTE